MEPFVFANIEECANEYGITSMEEAVAYLGKKFAGGQAKEYRIKRVETLLDRNLLPHLGNEPTDRVTKAIFMARMGMAVLELALGKREEDDKDARMGMAVLELALGKREEDDKDHYANKRMTKIITQIRD